MASRREFIKTGVSACLAPAILSPGQVAASTFDSSLSVSRVVIDGRFPAALAFGQYFNGQGISVRTIEGDITDLWCHDLSIAFRTGPIAIAGLTLNAPLFCFDQLVRRNGMRVVARAEHELDCNGGEVALLVHDYIRRSVETRPERILVPHLSRPTGEPERLVSWLLIPSGARFA